MSNRKYFFTLLFAPASEWAPQCGSIRCAWRAMHTGMLTLAPGVLAYPNGIILLAQRGFVHQVEAGAAKVFDSLSQYLSHPADGGKVLA